MSNGTVHIVGAGLAGLSAAVALVAAGRAVKLYEAGVQAGGRCRSYHDAVLDCRIDNGNHLLLAANRTTLKFLRQIGAETELVSPTHSDFPFFDRKTGETWRVAPNQGRLPWWIFASGRRVPGSSWRDYLGAIKLVLAGDRTTIAETLNNDRPIYQKLWQPLAVAALNTPPETGSAKLFGRLLKEIFAVGGATCRPLVPREGLSETFVDPALAWLAKRGTIIEFGASLKAIALKNDRAQRLQFAKAAIDLDERDQVILAVPAPVAAALIPDLHAPDQFCSIVNAHFKFAHGQTTPSFIGLVNTTAEWLFFKPGIVSVTISAGDRYLEWPVEKLAAILWDDITAVLRIAAPLPAYRIVKEKRATFAATPEMLAKRPGAATGWANLTLAGDWTETHLPATIEGAVRSGIAAADAVLIQPQHQAKQLSILRRNKVAVNQRLTHLETF